VRNMSFSKTIPQFRARTKTETMRLGWKSLKPGDFFHAVEKAQGLKKGEKHVSLGIARCLSNTTVRVRDTTMSNVAAEGFPGCTVKGFIEMFCELNHCDWNREVQRIKFEYMEESDA
jgi:hypothetical protein